MQHLTVVETARQVTAEARRFERGGDNQRGALLRHAAGLLLESETATVEAAEVRAELRSGSARSSELEARRQRIRQLRADGMTLRAIANVVGVGFGTVQRALAD